MFVIHGIFKATLAILLIFTASNAAHAQNSGGQAGVAAAVRGDVTLVASVAAQTERVVGQALGSGDKIFLGDNIETGPNSGMQIMLLDETIFTIGPDAGMVIDEFVYDPSTSTGQVTASIVKGAFRFVSGRVAKETPQNMNVRTPVGTIGIRGTSAAGRVDPPDANGDARATIVLLGPGANNNADERPGRILVTNGGNTVEITRSGFGTVIFGLNGLPTPPVRFEPAQVAALTGGLGTSGGAGTGQGGSGGSSGTGTGGGQGGGQLGSGQANAQSGQGLGAGAGQAGLSGQFAGTQNQASQQTFEAAETSTSLVNTAIATFDQLRSIETGTATFNFGTIALNYVSGTQTNAGGSFDANATINFGTRDLDLTVANIQYGFSEGVSEEGGGGGEFIGAGIGGEMFVFSPNDGGNDPFDSGYTNETGFVANTWSSETDTANFPTAPTDGSTAVITAAILNNVDAGIVAAQGIISMTISDANSDTIIAGAGVANRE